MSKNILNWLGGHGVGESSKCMAIVAMGGDAPIFRSYPHDPADLNRCLMLLAVAPEVREAFPKIRALSNIWEGLIDQWDALEALFLEEAGLNWSKARSAPKTYALMEKIRAAAK